MFEIIDKFYMKAASGLKESWLSSSSSEWHDHIRSLPDNEQIAYTCVILHNQVLNGGFHQYFTNGYGQFAKETIHHLKQIHAFEEADILEEVLMLVKPEMMSFASFRKALLERDLQSLFQDDDLFDPLDALDKKYYALGDSPLNKLEEFLKALP